MMRRSGSILLACCGWGLIACGVAATVAIMHPLLWLIFGGLDNAGKVLLLFVISVAMLLVGMLVVHTAGELARRRIEAGHCPHCGYDLRGSPASERCPECGGYV